MEEAKRVTKRLDVQLASQMSLFHMAISAQPNMNVKPAATKRLLSAFQKMVKDLIGDGK